MNFKGKQYQNPIAEAVVLFDKDIMVTSPEGNMGEWDPQNADMRAAECETRGIYTV